MDDVILLRFDQNKVDLYGDSINQAIKILSQATNKKVIAVPTSIGIEFIRGDGKQLDISEFKMDANKIIDEKIIMSKDDLETLGIELEGDA